MTRHDPELAQRLYSRAPDLYTVQKHLAAMGESLSTAAHELARDVTLEKIDLFLAKLKTAESNMQHLRRALAQEWRTGIHGGGSG